MSEQKGPVVRAKFMCLSVTHFANNGTDTQAEIRFTAVYGNGEDNRSWSKWTPSGELKMMVTNPTAIEAFELGKSYYLDFTPAA
ncbi:hypothetical protein [Rhizobium ruizarguesonis]|uniref:hypothetical protein n=1 Tax=Rhizobium ruizarguesonis TaxID=2081791 RepID=UPI00102F7A87|nr:hypothetical protein [Rhizobium ruizarguesonis]TBA16086.1 hypothetical protein ELH65_08955 [Rhizobium ruizarguesonis]